MTVLLHGFWGQPQDWNAVLARLPLSAQVLTPDLYRERELSPAHDLPVWTKSFLNWLDGQTGSEPVDLVGYSMGSRLAANLLVASPKKFRRALLLSANPVWANDDFGPRNLWEQQWKERFATQPWAELEKAWQDQNVFEGTKAMRHRHHDDLRELLGLSLENWSPRRHGFGLEEVKAMSPAVEWAFGALDQKYLPVAKSLQELPVQGQISIIPNAGHRLPFEAADFIAGWIERSHS